MAKALYTPFGLLSSILGGLIASRIFRFVWEQISDEPDPPKPRESEYGWRELLAAAALQGAIFTVVRTVIDRGGAKAFQRATGVWPGD
jgi:Protein of unknown function (DUF4235)